MSYAAAFIVETGLINVTPNFITGYEVLLEKYFNLFPH